MSSPNTMKIWKKLLILLSLFYHCLGLEEVPEDELKFFGAVQKEPHICSVIMLSSVTALSSEVCSNKTMVPPVFKLRTPSNYTPSLERIITTNNPNFEGENGFRMALYIYKNVKLDDDLTNVTYTTVRLRPDSKCYTAKWEKAGGNWTLRKIPISAEFKGCKFVESFYVEHFGEIYQGEHVCSWIAVSAHTDPKTQLEGTLNPKQFYPLLCEDELSNDTFYGMLTDRRVRNGVTYHVWEYISSLYKAINTLIGSDGGVPENFPEMEGYSTTVDPTGTTRRPRPEQKVIAPVRIRPASKDTPRPTPNVITWETTTYFLQVNMTFPADAHRAASRADATVPALIMVVCGCLAGTWL